MSSSRNASLYIFLSLMLLAGIAIFLFKQPLLSYLSGRVFGTNNVSFSEKSPSPSATAFNLKVLDNPDFQKLQDEVLYFDFNRVGKPVPQKSGLSIPDWKPVYLGNANPFFVPEVASSTKP